MTIIEDAKDNLYNEEAGKIEITAAGLQRTVTDVGVDFAIGGGTSAICAAVGTAIAPPLGTVVGFAVGMGIDYLVNSVEVDADGDGVKRSASDALKDGADALVDGVVGFA